MIRAKKHLGQHFLVDQNIARKITQSLSLIKEYPSVLEIGPGKGILTQHLLANKHINFKAIDIDQESIDFLHASYPDRKNDIVLADFLKLQFDQLFQSEFLIIGNFPYNISSQIVFRMLDNKEMIPQMVGMFQKEVAERFIAKPRTKAYGILSVLVNAFYDVKYLFTVNESVFNPRPKVKSAVVEFKRKDNLELNCEEELFFKIVKSGFNQRRKTLRNALKSYIFTSENKQEHKFLSSRAEELDVEDFVELTNFVTSVTPTNYE